MIQVEGLVFTYPGKNESTIKGLQFTVQSGEIFGFLGPSGAGKTTAQKLLFGLLKNYEGSIRFDGKDLRKYGRELYNSLGIALELPRFYPALSAWENLEYYRLFYPGYTKRAEDLMKRLGLWKDRKRKLSEYSKGMKMRLNLIRALQHDPAYLFLDEPTAGLDPIHAAIVKQILFEEAKKGKTIFLTTHNMSLAQDLCQRVGFLVDGELVEIANPDELRLRHRTSRVMVQYRISDAGSLESQEFSLQGLGTNVQFQQIIADDRLERICSIEPDLEEIFLETTGRKLQ